VVVNGKVHTLRPLPPTAGPAHEPGAPWSRESAAAHLGISVRTLTTLIATGRIRAIRIGSRRMVSDDEVRRVAREGTE
jgi:excisionase family DNA binding protein